jgi:hypothetical protein
MIRADGGGDTPESLLSASFHVMKDLHWKQGSTKSLVVLTDADFLSPDRDGMSFDEVVALSKRIDPVNFYIITDAESGEAYSELAAATDGRVVTNFDELSLLTTIIQKPETVANGLKALSDYIDIMESERRSRQGNMSLTELAESMRNKKAYTPK